MPTLGSQPLSRDFEAKRVWEPKSLTKFRVNPRHTEVGITEDEQRALFIYRQSANFQTDKADNHNPNKCHPAVISKSVDRNEVADFTQDMLLNLVSLAPTLRF